jgi:GDP-6-deoxy-D-talose 4-dehydrogenase
LRRILILGASGFMGRALAAHLGANGDDVRTPNRAQAPMTDATVLRGVIEAAAPEIVINLAGISSILHGDVREIYETNAFGHLRLLEAAAEAAPIARVYLASSANIYGRSERETFKETDPAAPVNHYAISKFMAERFNALFGDRLIVSAARPFNCVGRGQKPTLVLSKLVDAFRSRAPRIELGNLDVRRDFVDIRDVCAMWSALLEAPKPPELVNFGNGVATPLRDVISVLEQLTDHKPQIVSAPGLLRERDITYQRADTAVLESLGYKRRYALAETLAWMLSDQGEQS